MPLQFKKPEFQKPDWQLKEKFQKARQGVVKAGSWLFPDKPEQQEEQEESHFLQGLLQFVLWVAFAAFLLASLPHVAYFFASFEPEDSAGNVSNYWWIIAYALAASIDVTSFLLSISIAHKMQHAVRGLPFVRRCGAAFGVAAVHWPFILLLVGFSWLVNYEHATQFHSDMLWKAEQKQITFLFWTTTIGDLNPVISSAFPVLAVAYTGMADSGTAANKKRRTKTTNTTALVVANNANSTPVSVPDSIVTEQITTEQLLALLASVSEQKKMPAPVNTGNVSSVNTSNATRSTQKSTRPAAPAQPTPTKAKTTGPLVNDPVVNNPVGSAAKATLAGDELTEKVRLLVLDNPNIGPRAIARTLNISPSTAHKKREQVISELKANGLFAKTVDSSASTSNTSEQEQV